MTISMFVEVPKDAAWVAEVTTIQRKVGGEIRAIWPETVKAGEVRWFYPNDGQSVVVAEAGTGAASDGHTGLVGVFAFGLNQPVRLVGSDECGTVIARAEYAESCRNYLVRYRAGDGRLTEGWWSEAAIAAVVTDAAPVKDGSDPEAADADDHVLPDPAAREPAAAPSEALSSQA